MLISPVYFFSFFSELPQIELQSLCFCHFVYCFNPQRGMESAVKLDLCVCRAQGTLVYKTFHLVPIKRGCQLLVDTDTDCVVGDRTRVLYPATMFYQCRWQSSSDPANEQPVARGWGLQEKLMYSPGMSISGWLPVECKWWSVLEGYTGSSEEGQRTNCGISRIEVAAERERYTEMETDREREN